MNLLARVCCLWMLCISAAFAHGGNYHLQAEEIAPSTWVVAGVNEDFNTDNGGNILNTAFIATADGVVVIDVGPSLKYAQQLRALIAEKTEQAVVAVLLTHAHPDHIFGVQGFDGIPVYATASTIEQIRATAPALLDNLYRMTGDWMRGTESADADYRVIQESSMIFGQHRLDLLRLRGHTDSDLAIIDRRSEVLFAGDLVFHNRTPSTPNADIGRWLASLSFLETLDYSLLVPGHGPVSQDRIPLLQTRTYLGWLEQTVRAALARGDTINEVLATEIPPHFQDFGALESEFPRSVMRLYSEYEQELFTQSGAFTPEP